jgi:hypothetical protein
MTGANAPPPNSRPPDPNARGPIGQLAAFTSAVPRGRRSAPCASWMCPTTCRRGFRLPESSLARRTSQPTASPRVVASRRPCGGPCVSLRARG